MVTLGLSIHLYIKNIHGFMTVRCSEHTSEEGFEIKSKYIMHKKFCLKFDEYLGFSRCMELALFIFLHCWQEMDFRIIELATTPTCISTCCNHARWGETTRYSEKTWNNQTERILLTCKRCYMNDCPTNSSSDTTLTLI